VNDCCSVQRRETHMFILKCKVCRGAGYIRSTPLDFRGTPCNACKGTGEINVDIPRERLTDCKVCNGRGIVMTTPLDIRGHTCSNCRGLGLVERMSVVSCSQSVSNVQPQSSPRSSKPDYDLVISFAGQDRQVVEPYAEALSKHGVSVFYADFAQPELWGTNLYESFDAIYRLKAKYCVLFISKHYATSVWTNHERRSAQARALTENREYILPVRLDATEIPGLSPTIAYLDYHKVGLHGLVDATMKKLSG
jgi:hypothetical protein